MKSKAKEQAGSGAAFTLIELLAVMAIISLVAALVVSMAKYAAQTRIKTRVEADKRGKVAMIDSYYAKFGYYPPDNGLLAAAPFAARDGLAATNQLLYELTGVTNTNNSANLIVYDINGYTNVSAADFGAVFNRGGVANADAVEPHDFYQPGPAPKDCAPYFSNGKEVIYGLAVPAELVPGNTNNFWHYDSSSTNRRNMGSYDVWAEFKVGAQIFTNGNW